MSVVRCLFFVLGYRNIHISRNMYVARVYILDTGNPKFVLQSDFFFFGFYRDHDDPAI